MTYIGNAQSKTWTFVDGDWHEGNVPLLGPRSHAMWLGSTVFDGARYFDGLSPDLDLHCQRVNNSAKAMYLDPLNSAEEIEALALEGVKRFDGDAALYIKPMYWAEHGGFMMVPPDETSTRFCLCMFEAPMVVQTGFSMTTSPFRRPSLEYMPTNAKAGCLYPNSGRAILEAKSRGFDNALMLDMQGNIAETATSNIFLAKDGVVQTPVPNGSFLDGITRRRIINLLREAGVTVEEVVLTHQDFLKADEIFSTGNYAKIVPVIRFEDKELQPGPIGTRARSLYMEWAHSGSL